ncbi:urinary protein 2-like [Lampris incognitus]|uniref:urinary protein 2-like n=1 Tax=Lampris incognitus TaxID=2546036 RepID=UPI0024B4FB47|nr:urinary protein 2-like [Lampris incognitus]
MRTLLSLLFFLPTVLSLRCYVCSSSPTNEECNQNNQTCQAPLDTCMTIVDSFGNQKAIVKQCASKATCNGAAATASVDANGNGNTVNCCSSSNFCNFSGAGTLHLHAVLPALSVCVLLLVLH